MTPGNIQDLKLMEYILTTGIRFHIMNFYHLLSVTGPMHALASEDNNNNNNNDRLTAFDPGQPG